MAPQIALVLPTLNAEKHWQSWLESFHQQTFKPDKVLVIDSSSRDQTPNLAKQAGFQVHTIDRAAFNHGGTRQLAANLLNDADILIYMTQDAILAAPDSLEKLVSAFENPKVGLAYGRQLPYPDAKPIGTHARLFNYSATSSLRSKADIPRYGFKTAFCSDSFAAYRSSSLFQVDGFPNKTIFGEDAFVATKMLLADWSIAYVAEAQVYHSHDYTLLQEFKRYFDIGVFHATTPWMLGALGKAEGEGLKFLRSELSYLWKHAPLYLPSALLRTFLKYTAYKLGRLEESLPMSLKYALTMNRGYFQNKLENK
jgi:rhamnosyltransferase